MVTTSVYMLRPVHNAIYQNWIISLAPNVGIYVIIIRSNLRYFLSATWLLSYTHINTHPHIHTYMYKYNNNALITAVDTKRGAWQYVSTIISRRRTAGRERGKRVDCVVGQSLVVCMRPSGRNRVSWRDNTTATRQFTCAIMTWEVKK
jgi:hypothetical protein